MPVLLKFFAWSGTQIGGGGGGGSGFLGAAGAVAMAQDQRRRGAVDRAADIDATGPGSRSEPSSLRARRPRRAPRRRRSSRCAQPACVRRGRYRGVNGVERDRRRRGQAA